MKFSKNLLLFILVSMTACGSNSPSSGPCTAAQFVATSLPNVGSAGASANVMSVTVNGSLCGNAAYQYPNEICTSVTVCNPSQPSNCQTINNILVDTGSMGLRIFSSILTVPLTPIANGSQKLAECVQFGDGSSEWGPVQYAYVRLGTEPAVHMPIQVINSTFENPPALCSSSESRPDIGPQETGFNGILGVGLFAQDCGTECATDSNNSQYFTCNGTDCSCGAQVELSAQVQNPVSLLPVDNNGLLMALPPVSSTSGVASLTGTLYLGIGTQTNNIPNSVTQYPTDPSGNFSTVFSAFSSQVMPAFLDSGSSVLFFPAPTGGQLPDCKTQYGPNWAGAYCPNSNQSFSATNYGDVGTPSGVVSFQIGNSYSLLTSQNKVFNNLGNNVSGVSLGSNSVFFDWGLPFFFGRNVFVGIEGMSSSLGVGPYWAY